LRSRDQVRVCFSNAAQNTKTELVNRLYREPIWHLFRASPTLTLSQGEREFVT